MKFSELFTRSEKNAKQYDSVNATLLLKGGFVFQTMAGAYSFLPLGLRVLRKIENIVREEMDKIGQEILMPTTSPKSLWEKTGRINTIDVLAKIVPANSAAKSGNDTEYIINATHEEPNVPILQKYAVSYKDLPVSVYQIQTKFRNEARAKSGLMRGREFRMKDMYSYHASKEDLREYYEKVKIAYMKVFEKVGLGNGQTVIAMASGGAFTDDFSHEFQTICASGEDNIYHVKGTDIYYNEEIAPSRAKTISSHDEEMKTREDVKGEGIIGVEELAKFLNIPEEKTTKTLLYVGDNKRYIAAAVRGDYQINELKLKKVANTKTLELATEEEIKDLTGAEVGFLGPVGLPENVEVYYDESTDNRTNFECGANKTNYHSININWGRDLEKPAEFFDIKTVKPGDICPENNEEYEVLTSSEVGNIFPLHTKYSDAFDYKFIDKDGTTKPVIMGCYGIGTTRVMGVIVEKFHDDKGIIWPKEVAPFQIHLISLGEDEEIILKAKAMYDLLNSNNIEVLWDDRLDTMAGEKFADADLIGIPTRIVLSKRSLENGGIEVKKRDEKESVIVNEDDVLNFIKSL